jgi:MinD-like ATPase involved in chromosome partitioning or flagellar assembly/DNA-binding NarL/FixJ family response regulator
VNGPVEIAIGVSHRSWAQELFRHVADHGGAVVRTRVLLEEDALESSFAVLVVDDTASVLSPRLVAELHRRDRRVIAVHAAGDHPAREALARIGVDAAIPDSATPEELVDAIIALAPEPGAVEDTFAEIARELSHELPAGGPPPHEEAAPRVERGRITTVLATSGGAGATEVGLALAVALRHRGERSVLVDADEVAPSLAQRVALPLVPNLRNAVDALERGVGSLQEALVSLPPRDGGFDLLCGLANPRDWPGLRPDSVAEVVGELARTYGQVLVNAGSRTEEVIAPGGLARHGITRSMLRAADQLVLVGSGTPIGVARTLDWLADHADLARSKPLHVVLNQVPGGAFKRGELEREVLRSFLPSSLRLLPSDKRVEEALWNGHTVTSGPFAKAVQSLAAELPVASMAWPATGRRSRPTRSSRRAARRGARGSAR